MNGVSWGACIKETEQRKTERAQRVPFLFRHGQESDVNTALAQRRKKSKAKQNKVGAGCQMNSFPPSCPQIKNRTEKEAWTSVTEHQEPSDGEGGGTFSSAGRDIAPQTRSANSSERHRGGEAGNSWRGWCRGRGDSVWVGVEGWFISSMHWKTPQARDVARVSTKLARGTDYTKMLSV